MWCPTVSSDELYHHGILGQKWGIRRFQNPDGSLTTAGKARYGAESVDKISSAKGLSRRLNDVDQAMAFNKRDYSEARSDVLGAEQRKEKIASSRKGLIRKRKEIRKIENKAAAATDKMKKAEDYINAGQKEVDSLLKTAKVKGYNIKSKEIDRSVTRGKDVLKSALISGLAAATLGAVGSQWVVASVHTSTAPGTKYKVKEPKADKDISKQITNDTLKGDVTGPKQQKTSSQKKPMFVTIKGVPRMINYNANTPKGRQKVMNLANNMQKYYGWSDEDVKKYLEAHGI